MKRLIKKLEALTKISFLQISDAKAVYGKLSTSHDTSGANDMSDSFDSSMSFDNSVGMDYSIKDD